MITFLWLRVSFTRWASLIGTLLFLLVPFRFLSLYVTGQIGATLSFVFVPLILLGFDRYLQKKSTLSGITLALGVAGLITSHLLSAIIFFPFLLVYSSAQLIQKKKVAILPQLLGWGILGIGLSAFYLLPLLAHRNWVVLGGQQIIRFFDHWLNIQQLLYSSWGFGYSGIENQDALSFQLGISSIGAVFAAGALMLWKIV
jgi:uncharacterized membrane protein